MLDCVFLLKAEIDMFNNVPSGAAGDIGRVTTVTVKVDRQVLEDGLSYL